jgi:hypothetical protein
MSKQKAFLIYHDNKTFVDRLDYEQAGILFKAILSYEVDGKVPDVGELPDVVDMCFQIFKLNLDKAKADYEKRCKDKSEAGRKGGLARANNAKQNQASHKQIQANQQKNNINKNIKNSWAV